MNKRIIQPLRNRRDFDVKIHVFNVNISNFVIDGVVTNQFDYLIIPFDSIEIINQNGEFEKSIFLKCGKNLSRIGCRVEVLPHFKKINIFRQMYAESRVGEYISDHEDEYDVIVSFVPDLYFVINITVDNVLAASKNESIVWTTAHYDWDGYTNGYYIGHPKPMSKIMRRFEIVEKLTGITEWVPNYETILKRAFQFHSITRRITPEVFFKIRANKKVKWVNGVNLWWGWKKIPVTNKFKWFVIRSAGRFQNELNKVQGY